MSALYAASFYGHSTIIRVLLRAKDGIGRRKVDVEAKSGEGFTPMLIAAQEGQREALKVNLGP